MSGRYVVPRVYRRFVRWAAALCFLLLITPAPALAYIDPLSGSIILQVLAAGAFASLLTMKRFWSRVKHTFHTAWTRLTQR